MLQLQLGFPTGRFFAASVHDPRQPEWPPHPSRVFSALVAAAYSGGRVPTEVERELLRKLESAPAPSLAYPDADLREAPDSYVPVNDEKSRLSPNKSAGVVSPNRQARQFPSAFMLGSPEVTLCWRIDLSSEDVDALDHLASRVTHIGTSHSFVTARFARDAADVSVRLAPSDRGAVFLRTPQAGRLEELDRIAEQGHGTVRRPQPFAEALTRYTPIGLPSSETVPSAYEWIALRLSDVAWGADTGHTLARAARRAVMSILGVDAPATLHAHDPAIPHLGWLPLPDVGQQHARGRIRGLAVAIPKSISDADRAVSLAGIARLAHLVLPDGQVARLTPVLDARETPIALRSETWLQASTHWSTVTPVLLDRPPKRNDPQRILAALAESLVRAGFPKPLDMSATRYSDFDGAPGAADIPTRIPRYHARVVFPKPVEGPVIAGRWRNFGIGLFRPTPEEFRT